MLGVAFCWRSFRSSVFRSMALSMPKAAETGGCIVGPQVIDLKHCLCVCVCVSQSYQQTEVYGHRCVSLLPGRSHVNNSQVRLVIRYRKSILLKTELT
jgi:hypothetical protein